MGYYFVQSVKTKTVLKQKNNFKDAVEYTKGSGKGKYSLEIIATEVNDCHHNETR